MSEPQQFSVPYGHVVVTTYGQITQQTTAALLELRSFSEKNGVTAVKYDMIPATLVEKARNEAVRRMLKDKAGWLLFVDGDMTFEPNSLLRLLQIAYAEMTHVDAIGAYCPLRGTLALPTIDTGTGTWESWYPGSGVVEVMRTGGAFLLVKRHVFEGLKDPWFRMRVPARPVDFMAEVDNWARIKMDGANPFRGLPDEPWERLEKCARDDPSVVEEHFVPTEVGEDSGFCDRARNGGFRIFVDTSTVCGHVDQRIVTWRDHRKAMLDMEKQHRLCVGVLS